MAVVLLAGTARADDLFGHDALAHMMDTRPASLWSGGYFGVTLGYGWADLEATRVFATATGFGSGSLPLSGASTSQNSLNGGLTLGYNWYESNVVAGVEADVSYGDFKYKSGTLTANNVLTAGDTLSGNLNAGFNWFGTARGRLGFLVAPQTLLYGTGGLAWANAKASGSYSYNGGAGPVAGTFSDSHFEWGWTVGAGIEDKFAKNLSMKLEYLYLDYSNGSFRFSQPGVTVGFDTQATMHLVRLGLNKQF